MINKRTQIIRVDPEFSLDMKNIATIRLNKGLAKFNLRELSSTEMTKLLRRTDGYKLSLEELKTKPKRENQ